MDWKTGEWRPKERTVLRRWVDLVEPDQQMLPQDSQSKDKQ